MKIIHSSCGTEILVDDDVYDWAIKFKWYLNKEGHGIKKYARTSMCGCGKQIKIKLHQIIMGKREGLVIHHKNGNQLDNRRENMEHTTQSINARMKNYYGIDLTNKKRNSEF